MKKCRCTVNNTSENKTSEDSIRLRELNDELEASYKQLKSTTEQLYESEQKYKLLIDNMTDIIWIIDVRGNIAFINDVVENILGFKKEEMLGSQLYRFMCPLHQYANCSDIIFEMRNRDFYRQELWMVHSDGATRKVIETNTRRIYDNGTLIGVQGVGRDATERIHLERKLKKKNRQLSTLNEISSSIASSNIAENENILIENIARKVVEIMNVPLCTVRLIGEDDKLYCMAAAGNLSTVVNTAPVEFSRAEFKDIILNNDRNIISQICKQLAIEYSPATFDADKIDNMLFVPLLLNNEPIGIISIVFGDAFDKDYIDMLESIANNLSFAIEKADLYRKLKQNYLKAIKTLVAAIEAKDTYTQGHSVRVSQYAVKMARELGMTIEEIEEIEIAGILHDIGKIGINDEILTKPGKLEPYEFDMVKEHPSIGCRILQPIGLSENIINATLLHHKRFDLQGYPKDVHTGELPLIANIICTADAYDAMTSNRSYKPLMTAEAAIEELRRYSGTQFSPDTVEIMERLYEKKLI